MTYNQSHYIALKSAGLCVLCGKKPAENGKTRCKECKQRQSENQKAIRKYRADRGKCILCGEEALFGKKMCVMCRGDRRDYSRKYYAAHKDEITEEQRQKRCEDSRKRRERYKLEHRCITCGKPLPERYTKVRCSICNAKNTKRTEQYHRAKGVTPMELSGNGHYCAVCLKPVEIQGNKLCERCYANNLKSIKEANKKADRSYFRGLNKVFWEEKKKKENAKGKGKTD